MKLNSAVERYCLHGSTKVNEAFDFKMAANELVREGVAICDYLINFILFLVPHPLKLNQEYLTVSPSSPMHYPECFGFCSFPILHSTNILDCVINREPVVCDRPSI